MGFFSTLIFIVFLLAVCVLFTIPIMLLVWWRKTKKLIKQIPIKLQEEIKNAREEEETSIRRRYNSGGSTQQTGVGEPAVEGETDLVGYQEQIKEPQRVQVSTPEPISSDEPSSIRTERESKKDWPKFE